MIFARDSFGFTTNARTKVICDRCSEPTHAPARTLIARGETQIHRAAFRSRDMFLTRLRPSWKRHSNMGSASRARRIREFRDLFHDGCEIFAALGWTIDFLGPLAVEGTVLRKGFDLGVALGVRDGAKPSAHDLFPRPHLAAHGADRGRKCVCADYVSGMLIGAEIAAPPSARGVATSEITLIGRSDLLPDRYTEVRATALPGRSSARSGRRYDMNACRAEASPGIRPCDGGGSSP